MKKKVCLKDIAQKVGVSTALVSYVLNNQKQDRISKVVAQKIRDVAIELNYRPNQIAKSLKTSRTHTIGLVVADISNPFFSALARIIEDEAAKNNYTVLFGSSDENALKCSNLINVLLNYQVDGLIIAPAAGTEDLIHDLLENEKPFVLIDRYFPDIKASYVAIDNFKAAHSMVAHLVEKGGYQRIGMVTYKTTLFNLQERNRGYMAALKEYNLPLKKSWIREVNVGEADTEVSNAIDALLSLPEPVEAILFASNLLSTNGLKYLNTLKIKVPDDLAVISFDESEAAELFYAPLTHIKQPLQEMGTLATTMLLESIEKNNKITGINFEAELVERKSTPQTPKGVSLVKNNTKKTVAKS